MTSPDEGGPPRLLPLDGAFNFRDLGGYRGAEGRRVRWRALFRSDGLHRLSEADLGALGALGLRSVIDLRSAEEVAQRGRVAWPTATLAYHHLPMMDVLPPRDEFAARWADPDYVAEEYLRIVERGAAMIGGALEVLAHERAYPAVYHCAAGKDRTGILSAVVLGLLGVADDDIVEDYALSQPGVERLLERMRAERPDRRAEIDASAAAVAVAPQSMARFLCAFRDRHGSFARFAEGLGLGSAAEVLRDRLLEAPA